MALTTDKKILAAADANINRAKEGLRTAEDICRFVLTDKKFSSALKKLRHDAGAAFKKISPGYLKILSCRKSGADVGRRVNPRSEFFRKDIQGILISNFKRAQESLRVLEELSKLYSPRGAGQFKELRYITYETEKKILLKYYGRKNDTA